MPGPPQAEWIMLLYTGAWAIVAGYCGGRFMRHRAGLLVAFSPLIVGLVGLAAILIYGLLSGMLVYFYPLNMIVPVFFYSIIALTSYYIGLQHERRSTKDKSS